MSFFFFQAEDGIRDKLVTGVQTCALPISEVGDGDRDGSSLAEAAASVLAVGTLAQPAIAIAEPSASTHHRNPLIALSSPTRVHEFQRFPDSPSDGRSFPRDSPSKKEIARASLILEVSPAGVDEDHESVERACPEFDRPGVGEQRSAMPNCRKATEFNGL